MGMHRRRKTAALCLLLGGIAAFFLLFYHRYLFFSHTLEVKVVKNDAAEECYPRRTLLFGKKRRSHAPEAGYVGFCGAIFTDMGDYKLPRSSEYFGIHQRREYLQKTLVEGCHYEVTIVGYGGQFAVDDKPRYPIRQTITWINRQIGCEN